MAYVVAGRLPEAIALLKRVRDARIARLGPDHPDTLATLYDLALAYQSAGEVTEAIAQYERVRDARIARLGPDHPSTLATLGNLVTQGKARRWRWPCGHVPWSLPLHSLAGRGRCSGPYSSPGPPFPVMSSALPGRTGRR